MTTIIGLWWWLVRLVLGPKVYEIPSWAIAVHFGRLAQPKRSDALAVEFLPNRDGDLIIVDNVFSK